jgi:hypothetical protein
MRYPRVSHSLGGYVAGWAEAPTLTLLASLVGCLRSALLSLINIRYRTICAKLLLLWLALRYCEATIGARGVMVASGRASRTPRTHASHSLILNARQRLVWLWP